MNESELLSVFFFEGLSRLPGTFVEKYFFPYYLFLNIIFPVFKEQEETLCF